MSINRIEDARKTKNVLALSMKYEVKFSRKTPDMIIQRQKH